MLARVYGDKRLSINLTDDASMCPGPPLLRGGAEAARLAHNQEAVGASPTPASITGLKGIDGGLNDNSFARLATVIGHKQANANDNFAPAELALAA